MQTEAMIGRSSERGFEKKGCGGVGKEELQQRRMEEYCGVGKNTQ